MLRAAVTRVLPSRRYPARLLLVLVAVVALVPAVDRRPTPAPAASNVISGPYASLLAASTDLGPAHTEQVQLTVALRDHRRPDVLTGWTAMHGLSVRWRPGDDWAIVQGAPTKIAGLGQIGRAHV